MGFVIEEASGPEAVDIYLCRHGRTAMNAAGRLRGRLDPDLDLVGVAEARDLGRLLGALAPARVVASPLRRAVATAAPVADAAGVTVEIDDRLADRAYGRFDGAVKAEVVAEFGSLDAAPGVEPATAVFERAAAALADLVRPDGPTPVVVVSHDAVIRQLLNHLTPGPGQVDHVPPRTGCWSLLRHDGEGWHLLVANSKDDPQEVALARA
ncbi:histidine phosphatase family protein [Propionicimonas sp.]|uniref:histidine phosphatase family protein n=1 Tax=Propionicimonas sp. TaxID=1955623 RepID=UPI0039E5A252